MEGNSIPRTQGFISIGDWNTTQQKTNYFLKEYPCEMAPALPQRLLKYALDRCEENGLKSLIQDWEVSIQILDADEAPSNRYYTVCFKNRKGAEISLCGIYTKSGWPFLDHGFQLQEV